MGNPRAIRLLDRILGFLLRPGVRRFRRWSFVVTIPLGLVVANHLGLRPSVEHGLVVAALLLAVDLAIVVGVAALGTALFGRERRDALLDLLMHPLARRAVAGELRLFAVYPRALRGRRRRSDGQLRFSYHRGSSSLGFALALLPGVAAETTAVHLLLPDDWSIVKLALLGLTLYGTVMMVGLALAERVYPHELDGATLTIRGGTLYRASIALENIAAIERRRERAGLQSGRILDGDAARIVARGRTDLVLTLREPAMLERPIGDPVAVTRLALAIDDPAALTAALAAPARAAADGPPSARALASRARRDRARGRLTFSATGSCPAAGRSPRPTAPRHPSPAGSPARARAGSGRPRAASAAERRGARRRAGPPR